MPDPAALTEVLVSVQDAAAGNAHLAAGLLGDRDLVLVPSPPLDVLDPGREFQVVTIPLPLDAGFPVERLQASCVNAMWIRGDRERPMAAMLKLRTSSGYSPTMRQFNGAALAAQLDRGRGDLWSALEELGTIREGLRAGPADEILAALPDIERRQRQANYRDHDYAKPGDIGWSICRWLCICHPQ